MKFLKFLIRFSLSFILAVLLIALGLELSGNGYLIKAVRSTYLQGKTGPTIADFEKFENRRVSHKRTSPWPIAADYNQYHLSESEKSRLAHWESVAFLIIHKDSLLFEKYWEDYDDESFSNSFSVAKSLVSLSIGAAIKKGCINSIEQKVGDFIPEFNLGEKAEIRIVDLLSMSSGVDFGESYGDPFGYMAKTYYGQELYPLTVNKTVKHSPGEVWKYQGGNTLLLSFIISRACGQNLSDFFAANIWQEVEAEKDALWTITEEEGEEKAYCCYYSNARDFARIGQLILDSGKWKGKALIERDYFEQSVSPVNIKDESGKLIDYYGYQWWLGDTNQVKFHYARGIQGQYIVSIPEWDMVLVRLGHKRDPNVGAKIPSDLIEYLEIAANIKP